MLIYFVRHGETDWNKLKKHQGAEIDQPLNDNGRNQAELTRQYLKNHSPFDAVYSSPLTRAIETATIISQDFNDRVIIEHNLIEKQFGTLTGKTPDEIASDPQFVDYVKLKEDWKNIKDPIERMKKLSELENKLYELYGIETNISIMKRCQNFLEMIQTMNYKKVLVVTHGGTMSSFMKYMFNLKWNLPKGEIIGFGNCKIMVVRYENGHYYMECEPHNEHLNI